MTKSATKDEVYWTVLNAAIELDFKKGHLKWSMTELAKKSKITRSLIYYYFGPSREDIVKAAVNVISSEIFGLTPAVMEPCDKDEFEPINLLNRAKAVLQNPYLAPFYLNHRSRETFIGEMFREQEKKYLKKLSQYFPKRTTEEIEAIWCYIFGIVVAPSLTNESRAAAANYLRQFAFTETEAPATSK